MRVGYARVSRIDQDPGPQEAALAAAACETVYTDRASGVQEDRPQLAAALGYLRPGDELVVWKFDRLARSLRHLLALADELRGKGVDLLSLTEGIDTTKPGGKVVFAIFGAMAEFERDLVSERTKLAIAAARRDRKPWGRRTKFEDPAFVETAKALLRSGTLSKRAVARQLGIDPATLYRHFRGGDPDRFLASPNVRRARGA